MQRRQLVKRKAQEYTAPDLLRIWQRLYVEHTGNAYNGIPGRDLKTLKELQGGYTNSQIVLGMREHLRKSKLGLTAFADRVIRESLQLTEEPVATWAYGLSFLSGAEKERASELLTSYMMLGIIDDKERREELKEEAARQLDKLCGSVE